MTLLSWRIEGDAHIFAAARLKPQSIQWPPENSMRFCGRAARVRNAKANAFPAETIGWTYQRAGLRQ